MGCVIVPAAGNRKMMETQSDPGGGVGDRERNKLVTMNMTGDAEIVKLPHRSWEEAAGIFRQSMKGWYTFKVSPKNTHVGNSSQWDREVEVLIRAGEVTRKGPRRGKKVWS